MLVTSLHRVVIVDSHPWVLHALRQLIQLQTGFIVSQTFTNWRALFATGIDPRLSIILLDWESPWIDHAAISLIRRGITTVKVIGMGVWWESRVNALAAGFDDFIIKTDMPEQVVAVLKRAVR